MREPAGAESRSKLGVMNGQSAAPRRVWIQIEQLFVSSSGSPIFHYVARVPGFFLLWFGGALCPGLAIRKSAILCHCRWSPIEYRSIGRVGKQQSNMRRVRSKVIAVGRQGMAPEHQPPSAQINKTDRPRNRGSRAEKTTSALPSVHQIRQP